MRVPKAGQYRGVDIFAGQTEERLARVVRPAIDQVHAMANVGDLVAYAGNADNPPEARLLAALKVEGIFELAVEERRERPNVDLEQVRASVAGLDSGTWYNPETHRSLLDPPPDA